MKISLTLKITRDRTVEDEPEGAVQLDMSGVNIEIGTADLQRELEMTRRRVGFGTH